MKTYKILNLHAENIKKLKVVDITPAEGQDVVEIAGQNGNGKTSVLDSILWACGGEKLIQGKPIREGETAAAVVLDLGELVIKRNFTEKGSYLYVETKEGARFPSPQKILDEMMGAITFDPLEFTRMEPKKQYQTLRQIVDIDLDIDAEEVAIKQETEERQFIGREVKTLEGAVASIPEDAEAPDQPIDVTDKVKELTAARDKRQKGTVMLQNIETAKAEVADLETKLAAARDKHTAALQTWEEFKPTVPTKEDVAALEETIQNADALNQRANAKRDRAAKVITLTGKKAEYDKLTDKIATRRQAIVDAIGKAKMPIKGLALQEGAVYYNGIPFDQASGAEQVKVSAAMAMAMNPTLRVIRIKDASLLDEGSMAALRDLARANDFQVWAEVITSTDPMAVIIEDGEVKAPAEKKKAAGRK